MDQWLSTGIVILSTCVIVAFILLLNTSQLRVSKFAKNSVGTFAPVRVVATDKINLQAELWPLSISRTDGVQLNEGDALLLNNQESAYENGAYVIGRQKPDTCTFVRSPDMSRETQLIVGYTIYVDEGVKHSRTLLVLQVLDTGVLLPTKEKFHFRLALTFLSHTEMMLGTSQQPVGAVLIALDNNRVGWQMPSKQRTSNMQSHTSHTCDAGLSLYTVTWEKAWLSTQHDTMWLIYATTTCPTSTPTSTLTRRFELIVSPLPLVRFNILSSEVSLAHTADINIDIQSAKGEWWSVQENYEVLISVQSKAETHTDIRLFRTV